MRKTYERGFYGGKFLPFHKGHLFCIDTMARQCEEAVVIFFSNSEEEKEILGQEHPVGREILTPADRIRAIREACSRYDNVRFEILDCAVMHRKAIEEGTDPWDAETPYVMETVGPFQAVYSSEPHYDDYFRRAYPFAAHILVDPPRIHVPISGTQIRDMDPEEARGWMTEPEKEKEK